MPPVAALALGAGTDAVGTWWGIGALCEAVDTGIEGADGGRLKRCEAGDLREARMGVQVVGPLSETFIVEQQQEEGPQHTERIGGRSTARARSVERAQEGPGRVQIELQEHEGGRPSGLGQGPRLARSNHNSRTSERIGSSREEKPLPTRSTS